MIGRPFSQQVELAFAAPALATPLLVSDTAVVPTAFWDVWESAPGLKAPDWVPPLGLNDGGLVSDNGDWALRDVVGAAAAVCPTSS